MRYHITNIGGPVTNAWWRRIIELGIFTAGYQDEPGDKGEKALLRPAHGDWLIAYASGFGYVGAGVVGARDTYRLMPRESLPLGYEATMRHWRGVAWKHVIPDIANAVTVREANHQPPPQTVQALNDEVVAKRIIELVAARGVVPAEFLPGEFDVGRPYVEGATFQVLVNRYERDPAARAASIAHHGLNCLACDLDFQARYGPLGAGFIHVHHLIPISSIGREYKVDPIADLVPLCPNCHAMVHRHDPPLTVEELRGCIKTFDWE